MRPPSAGGSSGSFSKWRRSRVVSIQEALVLASAQPSDLRVVFAALEQDSVGHQRGDDASGPFTELNTAVLGQSPFGLNIRRGRIVKNSASHKGLCNASTRDTTPLASQVASVEGGVIMKGKLVYIKRNGDNDISAVLIQRSLLQRQHECQSTLFMADGRPAGRLWKKELGDLVETKRAAVKVLQAQGQTTFHSQPELPGTTPDGLLTSLFPIGCTVEVLPYVGPSGFSLSELWCSLTALVMGIASRSV